VSPQKWHGTKSKARTPEKGGFLGRGCCPLHQLGGLEERCKIPQWSPEQSPRRPGDLEPFIGYKAAVVDFACIKFISVNCSWGPRHRRPRTPTGSGSAPGCDGSCFFSTTPRNWLGRLSSNFRNNLFCVEWEVTLTQSINLDFLTLSIHCLAYRHHASAPVPTSYRVSVQRS